MKTRQRNLRVRFSVGACMELDWFDVWEEREAWDEGRIIGIVIEHVIQH